MFGASLPTRLLTSRFLTAAGDYAWDLALALTCAQVFSEPLRYSALLFLLYRIAVITLLPAIGRWMDRTDPRILIRAAIGVQLVAVVMATVALNGLSQLASQPVSPDLATEGTLFLVLLVACIGSGLGHTAMEIAIDNHWIPGLLSMEQYSAINARLRRLVLLTESSIPPVTGVWLTVAGQSLGPLTGFYGVAAFNLFTFYLEYRILSGILDRTPVFVSEKAATATTHAPEQPKANHWANWQAFVRHPLALVFVAQTCLWFTVLSPHSALLTVFLRVRYSLSDWTVSVFRGAGAFTGVLATVLFPFAERRLGLTKAGGLFITFQALCLLVAAGALLNSAILPLEVCMGAIVCSRIGLYGFTLSDTQLRQRHIAAHERAGIVGMARSLNNMGTLLIYSSAAVFSDPADFPWLGLATALSVTIGAIVFAYWRTGWERQGEKDALDKFKVE